MLGFCFISHDCSSLLIEVLRQALYKTLRSILVHYVFFVLNRPQEISAREIHGSVDSMSTSRISWGLVPEEYMAGECYFRKVADLLFIFCVLIYFVFVFGKCNAKLVKLYVLSFSY